jgi:hypothetical protein
VSGSVAANPLTDGRNTLMRTVSFKNGETMGWPDYRRMMLGEVGPRAVAARLRRAPAGALDAALPRRQARDQNGGKLENRNSVRTPGW